MASAVLPLGVPRAPHAPPRPAAAPSQRGALARRADRQMHRLENMDRDAWRQRAGRHLERVRRLREHGLGRRDRIVRRRPRPSHARRAREPCARGASHITAHADCSRPLCCSEITPEGKRVTKLDQILLNGNNVALVCGHTLSLPAGEPAPIDPPCALAVGAGRQPKLRLGFGAVWCSGP